jgi:DNA-binding transcriptional MerR regulator
MELTDEAQPPKAGFEPLDDTPTETGRGCHRASKPLQVRLKSMAESEPDLLTIGELAQQAGVATSALRYYEELGLLEPGERRSGRRYYRRAAVETVGSILFLRDVGFTLAEIVQLRSSSADRPARRALLASKLEELARKAVEISVARDALNHGLDCPAPDILTCPNFIVGVHERLTARVPWTQLQSPSPSGSGLEEAVDGSGGLG